MAVLIVVAFHAGIPGFEGGFVGVDVFFVLSGYLITWLLVHEAEQKGSIDLRRFYARRARRLLPALGVVLLGTLVGTALLYAPFEQRRLARTWATTALYVSNIDFANAALGYHGASAKTNPLLHTWSLSVEEQFYLVWPWIVLLGVGLLRWQKGRLAVGRWGLLLLLGSTAAVSFAASFYLTYSSGAWAFYSAPTRAWEFAAGGVAVLLPAVRWPRQLLDRERPWGAAAILGWLGLLGLGAATVLYRSETPFPGMAALLPVLATVVLLWAGAREQEAYGSLNRVLSSRPLQAIGKLSYSWYLWHWPALVFAGALVDPLTRSHRIAAVSGALLLAHLSYRYVEAPVRHHGVLARRPGRTLAMAGGMAMAGVVVAGLWWRTSIWWSESAIQLEMARVAQELPRIYQDGCDHFGRAELTECAYGAMTSTRTAVLVGDSHAGQFFPPLHGAALASGWRLVVLTLSACPAVDVPVMFNGTLGRPYPECVRWRESALEAIARLKPEVTFVSSASQYDVTPARWEAGTRSTLSSLLRASRRVVLILDTPLAGVDVPVCLARAAWRPTDALDPACAPMGQTGGQALVAAQERAARSMPAVEILDIRDDVCGAGGCAATKNGVVRYRDGGHLSVEFALTFSDVFARYLGDRPRGVAGRQD